LKYSVLFGLAPFLSFPLAISVDDQQDKNNEAGDSENDDDGFVTPHIAYKIGNVRTHIFTTYTIFIELKRTTRRRSHSRWPAYFSPAARASARCGIGNQPQVCGASGLQETG
jgi:hypothetical protein